MSKGAAKQRKALPIHIACLTGNKGNLKKIISTIPRRGLELRDYLGRTPLILTASRNHIDCGAALLKAGVTVDNTDNAGQTALHVAACKGFQQFVRLLLSYKASLIQRDFFGATALHMAAIHPNMKGLTVIVKHVKPAEIDIQDSSLKTALHWSAAYACNNNIKVLLAQGANTCIPDEDGKTPLHWAVANSNPEALDCVKTLLKKEPNLINWQDYQGRSPLHVAVACGSEEILYFLASRENCNVDILDNSFCTPLHCAAKRGLSEKADILLKKRASHLSIDDNGATPLHYAAHNNHAETVQMFTSKSYINDEPDKFGRSALMWAAVKNSEAALTVLTSMTMTLLYADGNGVTALHAAAIYGHVPAIELLVNAGLFVDMKDKYGMTPFLRACEFGRSKAAQALLNLGANIDETDINFCSALHWCARGGHAYLTEILIKRGADYNIQDSLRMAPLHYTSATGDFINCTCVLIESGADPNIIDIEGKTPLHCAVLNERIGIIRYLCEHDSDMNAMFLLENDWVTPYDCALFKCNVSIAVLLKQYGGIQAQDVKKYAVEVIQTWYKRMKKSRPSAHSKMHESPTIRRSISLPFLPIDMDNIPLPLIPVSFFDYKKCEKIFHACSGCFHEVVCSHECNDKPAKAETAANVQKASLPSVCVPTSDFPESYKSFMKSNDFFHIDSGKFHKISCSHKGAKDLEEERAATVIQRFWKQYTQKKSFANVRRDVQSTFSDRDDMRLVEEACQQVELQEFYKGLLK